MVTLSDVAQRAGVSKSTASRALNEDPNLAITELTKQKILTAARELGYQHRRAKQLGTVYQIAIIHKETHYQSQADNAYYFSIRYGIETTCHSERIKFSFLLNTMLKDLPPNLDGAIINGNYNKAQMEEICRALGDVPAVAVGGLNSAPASADLVTFDVCGTVWLALDHLAEKGRKSVLYLGGRDAEGTPDWRKKIYYYRTYLANHPEMTSIGELQGDYGIESGYRMMCSWIESGKPLPKAVFASHDPIAVGAVRALAEHGISIPEETSVVGINGDEIGRITVPPLTTVCVHTEEMGHEAVMSLIDKIKSKRTIPKKVIFRPNLIQRQST